MFRTIKEFWQDNSGLSRNVTLLVEAIMGVAVTAMIVTTLMIGIRNAAVKQKNAVENASP